MKLLFEYEREIYFVDRSNEYWNVFVSSSPPISGGDKKVIASSYSFNKTRWIFLAKESTAYFNMKQISKRDALNYSIDHIKDIERNLSR